MHKINIKEIINIIKTQEYLENVIFISFDYNNMVELRKLLPNQKLQYLVCSFNNEILKKLLEYDLDLDIDIEYKALNKEVIDILHSNGIEINCWPCDAKEAAEKLSAMGVDYITSIILE